MAAPPRSGPAAVATVPGKDGIDHAELAAAVEDRASAAAVVLLARGVPVLEGHVLDDEPGRGLILAVRRGPYLGRVTGVHVEDAPGAAAAERHLPAAVQHHLGTGVTDLGGGMHHDRHWRRTAVEGDHAALGDGRDHGPGRAASGRPVADHLVRVGGVHRPCGSGDGRASVRVPGQGPLRLRGLLAPAGQGGRPGFASARGPGRRGRYRLAGRCCPRSNWNPSGTARRQQGTRNGQGEHAGTGHPRSSRSLCR